jgi:hypothetical protein
MSEGVDPQETRAGRKAMPPLCGRRYNGRRFTAADERARIQFLSGMTSPGRTSNGAEEEAR